MAIKTNAGRSALTWEGAMDTISIFKHTGRIDSGDAVDLIERLFKEHEAVISDLEREKAELEKQVEELENKVEELESNYVDAMEQILTLERAFQEGTR